MTLGLIRAETQISGKPIQRDATMTSWLSIDSNYG